MQSQANDVTCGNSGIGNQVTVLKVIQVRNAVETAQAHVVLIEYALNDRGVAGLQIQLDHGPAGRLEQLSHQHGNSAARAHSQHLAALVVGHDVLTHRKDTILEARPGFRQFPLQFAFGPEHDALLQAFEKIGYGRLFRQGLLGVLSEKGVQNRVKVELVQLRKDLKAAGLNSHAGADALGRFAVAHHVTRQDVIKLQLLGREVFAQHPRLLMPLW